MNLDINIKQTYNMDTKMADTQLQKLRLRTPRISNSMKAGAQRALGAQREVTCSKLQNCAENQRIFATFCSTSKGV